MGGSPFNSKAAMRFSPKIRQKLRTLPLGALVTAAVIAAAFGFSLAVNLPGHLSYDSVIQLYEGRTGAYNGWHPPVMSWLLGLFDALVPGPALFVVFDTQLLYGAMLSLIFVQKRVSWAAAVIALGAAALPQFLLYPGIVWKDVLFANAAVAGFVALALAAAHWDKPRWRFSLIFVSALFLVLATLARQNGVLLLLAGAAGLGWIAVSQVNLRKRREALVYGGGLLVVAIVAITAANIGLSLRKYGDSATVAQFRLLQIYDIVGMKHADPSLALPVLQTQEPDLAAEVAGDGVRVYTPTRNDTLVATPRFLSALGDSEPSNVFAQWRSLIATHPWLYAKVRAAEFWQVFATPNVTQCMPYKVGIEGPPDKLRALGMSERDDDRDDALDSYAGAIQSTPAFSHVTFLILGAASCYLLWRRRRAADLAFLSLFGGMTLFAASFFVISIACDYRYLYGIDLSAMIVLFYLALDLQSVWLALKTKKAGA
jgi:hypothetical protein